LVIDTIGTYYVKITNKTFCQAWDTIQVEEKPTPEKPQISDDTEELASTIKAHRYRWFLNDTFLKETENRSIKPTQNGQYQVRLVSEFGCESERSDSFLVDNIGIDQIKELRFKVYPNPSDGKVSIELEQIGQYSVELYELTGKLVDQFVIISNSNTTYNFVIDNSGTYLLILKGRHGITGQKLITIHSNN